MKIEEVRRGIRLGETARIRSGALLDAGFPTPHSLAPDTAEHLKEPAA